MQRLLLISNRLPVTIEKKKGSISFNPSVGGLATGLGSFYKSYNSLWIGWCGIPSNNLDSQEKNKLEKQLREQFHSYPTFLSKQDIKLFYSGFCNKTIWPLFHYFTEYTKYSKDLWKSYHHVNRLFENVVTQVAEPDDIIWIHDYQLMLLPQMIREKLPNAQIGFFLHIPFPSYEIFRLLPWREEILSGLLGSDLIGFHTYDYVRHFLSSIRRILGYEHTIGQIFTDHHIIKVDAFPMGIDYDRYANAKSNPEWIQNIKDRCRFGDNCKIIISVDRMDYTKGIPQRLEAFDCFLEKYPKYRQKITLILVAVPSRTGVETYRLLKQQIDEMVGRINGKYGTVGWMPVWYFYRSLNFEQIISLYKIADVALVTPLRDGMNLVAKEYIAAREDNHGMLVLSEMAGAASELPEAIHVNPNNIHDVADAIEKAITLTEEELVERNTLMQNRLRRYNIITWAEDFIDRLMNTKKIQSEIGAKILTRNAQKKLIIQYRNSKNRLIFLDYDGTLVPFVAQPSNAKPDERLLTLIGNLAMDKKNEVVIISGRDKNTLESWLGDQNIGLSAEHGVWVKARNGKWHMLESIRQNWKEEIRNIMEIFVDRTPGSFVEEKTFSLVWHYRKADPELGPIRSRELKDALLGLTANLHLVVSDGSKILEVKHGGINKGHAASFWTANEERDFILAIGDDWTDEDLFEALPDWAFTIKVGINMTKAKYYVSKYTDIRTLLQDLIDVK